MQFVNMPPILGSHAPRVNGQFMKAGTQQKAAPSLDTRARKPYTLNKLAVRIPKGPF